jgi:hypothetical protein
VPSGHSRRAASELELGAFTEHSDRVRELRDNKSEWNEEWRCGCFRNRMIVFV